MTQNRIVQLDALRFVAVFMIFIAHWVQGNLKNVLLLEIPFIHGVTMFFVISGYLITKSLFENQDKKIQFLKIVRIFYLRRFLRIFPIYYLLLGILFYLNFEQTRELIWWLVSYTTNIYQSFTNLHIQHLNHLWSLAVEEQFYVFWPFIILLTKPNYRLPIISITIILSLLVKAYLFIYVEKWMATAYFTLSCMYALGLGALLAYLNLYRKDIVEKISNPIWLYVALMIYAMVILFRINSSFQWFKEVFDGFVFAIISMLLVQRASNNGFKSFGKLILEQKFLIYLGRISYGLYLYHLVVPSFYSFVSAKLEFSIGYKPLLFFIYLFITILISQLSWIVVEVPINRLKNKYRYD